MDQLKFEFSTEELESMNQRRALFPDRDGLRSSGRNRRWINVKGSNIIAMVDDRVYKDKRGVESLRVLYLMMDGTHFTRTADGMGILHEATIIKRNETWYLDDRSSADLDDILNRTRCTPQHDGQICLLEQPSVSPVYEESE